MHKKCHLVSIFEFKKCSKKFVFIPTSFKNNVIVFELSDNDYEFCMYDFGKRENRERYGQDTPPVYSIEKITAPVAAYWSENDWMAAPEVRI